MQNFTDHGLSVINDVASRYGLSSDAVIHMLFAVNNGGGSMAQFNCPELGGGGQWMQGGMTMVGDMFNNGLKNTVDNLCGELSSLLYNQGSAIFAPVKPVPVRPSDQSSGQQQSQGGSGMGQNSIYFSGGGSGNWWPDSEGLGMASSTGGQNNLRYAVFPQSHRLAIEVNGQVTIYDTLDHQIGGVSQQQSGDASMSFTSQYGLVQVSQLPIVSLDGVAQQSVSEHQQPPQVEFVPEAPAPFLSAQNVSAEEEDIFEKIEKLAGLRDKGIVSEDEFSIKKSELLSRL